MSVDGLEFRVLGPLEVRTAGGDALPLGRRKQRLLLAVLLLRREPVRTTEQLVDLLWDERPPSSATANLYSYLSELRRILPPGRLDGHTLVLRPGDLDADRFTGLATEGLAAVTEQRYDVAAERLSTALGLWRTTTVAEGLALPADLRAEVARLERLRVRAVEATYRARLSLGQHAGIAAELEDLLVRRPLDEPLWALLVEAQYRSGRRADALDAYDRARKVLQDELGVEPGPVLRDIHRRVLRSDPGLDGPAQATVPVIKPAQLPADLASFTGRRDEVDRLTGMLADDPPGAVVIAAIDGMAGIGKTALATHVAHRLRDRYRDGQLFLDLHGHTRDVPPVDPADALDRMLRSLGVRGEDVPPGLEGRTALFRTTIAGRRVLVVLDNAASESQVRPLLPGTPGSAVLITSRARLSGLDDVRGVSLDLLEPGDATQLFTRVAGPDRIGSEAAVLDETVGLCGMLPLAIRLAAGRLRARPAWSLADLVARLRDEDSRLAELSVGERSVATSLELSYQYLGAAEQQMFRLLGQHPGADVEPYAVAALAGCSVVQAEHLLEVLLDAHLLMQRTAGRYVLHDLLRVHAADLGRGSDSEDDRRAATGRLLDYYVVAAAEAMNVLYPADRADRPDVTGRSSSYADGGPSYPVWSGEDSARMWLDGELTNLLAAAGHAAGHGWPEHTVQLARILAGHLRVRYDHDRALPLFAVARRCAVELGDRQAEFALLHVLGEIHRRRAEHRRAAECFRAALAFADQIEDRAAVCDVMYDLGFIERLDGRVGAATRLHEDALELARSTGHRSGELRLLNALGMDHLAVGDREGAERCYDQALEIATEVGDRWLLGNTLNYLAKVYRLTGRFDQALTYYRRAAGLARESGDRRTELVTGLGVGDVHLSTARYAEALAAYETALPVTRALGDPMHEAETLRRIGQAQARLGDHDSAIRNQRLSLEIADRLAVPNLRFETLLDLCGSLRGRALLDESLQYGEQSADLARELGQRHDEGRALSAVGDTYAARGDDDRARQQWQRALEIFTELGAPERDQVAERLRLSAGQ